jgi:hypothetical protein
LDDFFCAILSLNRCFQTIVIKNRFQLGVASPPRAPHSSVISTGYPSQTTAAVQLKNLVCFGRTTSLSRWMTIALVSMSKTGGIKGGQRQPALGRARRLSAVAKRRWVLRAALRPSNTVGDSQLFGDQEWSPSLGASPESIRLVQPVIREGAHSCAPHDCVRRRSYAASDIPATEDGRHPKVPIVTWVIG